MNESTRVILVTTGVGLVTVAVAPTPDDVTIISPLAQIVVGVGLIYWGSRK